MMYFIGKPETKGTFFWHSNMHNGWIVADMDTERCHVHDRLVMIKLKYPEFPPDAFERRGVTLGEDETRRLVTYENALVIHRDDEAEDIEILMIYRQDGKQVIGAIATKEFEELSNVTRDIRKKSK